MNDKFIAETSNADFKVNLEVREPKSWLKSVSAFSNGLGGFLYFGIDDKTHEIIGIENPQECVDRISEIIKDKIAPSVSFAVTVFQEEDKNIIQVEVESGNNTPYYYTHKGTRIAYVRVGNESIIAPEYILSELILKGRRESFDSIVTDKSIKDLSFTLLKATYKQEAFEDFNEEKDFVSFGLADDKGKVTYAGILFSDQCPLFQSRVVCTRWNGLNKASRSSRCN
jgi:ATP-dependent DNA helicase RecG